jgi:hypothetical protein
MSFVSIRGVPYAISLKMGKLFQNTGNHFPLHNQNFGFFSAKSLYGRAHTLPGSPIWGVAFELP